MTTYPSSTTYPGAATFPDPPDQYMFRPPTQTFFYPMEGRLRGEVELGKNVRRDADGVWHTEFYTSEADRDAATAFYEGGREHLVSEAQHLDLVAGGFAAYITILEAQ